MKGGQCREKGFAGSEKRLEPHVADRSPHTFPTLGLASSVQEEAVLSTSGTGALTTLTGVEHTGQVIWKVQEEVNPTFCFRGHLSGEHILRGMRANECHGEPNSPLC